MKHKFFATVFLLLLFIFNIPLALAQEDEGCGITNLDKCVSESLYNLILLIFNAPLLPFLAAIKSLLTAEAGISTFYNVWLVIRYILSFFYIFLFLYTGFVFITSNANPIKREHAKETLKNTFIMLVLIQGSFYIYDLVIDLSNVISNTILSIVDPHFFMLTIDNPANIGLEVIFSISYMLMLLICMILLTVRYIIISLGVVLFPIGIFCYFIPPLREYGKFILNLLGIFIFINIIDFLIILACSMLVETAQFENFKIIMMITCFAMIDYTLLLAINFASRNAVNSSLKEDISRALKYIALFA